MNRLRARARRRGGCGGERQDRSEELRAAPAGAPTFAQAGRLHDSLTPKVRSERTYITKHRTVAESYSPAVTDQACEICRERAASQAVPTAKVRSEHSGGTDGGTNEVRARYWSYGAGVVSELG